MTALGSPRPSVVLDVARQQASMTVVDVWVGYLSVGGTAMPTEMVSFVSGDADPDRVDYNMVAVAINERFMGDGMGCPVPYFDELT